MTASATFRVHLLAHSSQICSPFFSNLRKFLEKHEDGDLAVSHPFQNTAYNRSFCITLMLIKGASTVIKCESVRFASERSRVRIPPGPPPYSPHGCLQSQASRRVFLFALCPRLHAGAFSFPFPLLDFPVVQAILVLQVYRICRRMGGGRQSAAVLCRKGAIMLRT